MIEQAIKKLVNQEDLTYNEARQVMDELMSGQASAVQTASYLTALAMKGKVKRLRRSRPQQKECAQPVPRFIPIVQLLRSLGLAVITSIHSTSQRRHH